MHASLEQLLARRDGEPLEASALAHIRSCGYCGDALARLEATRRELREMAEVTPPGHVWANVAERVAMVQRRPRPVAVAGAVVAATLLIVIAATVVFRLDVPVAREVAAVPAPVAIGDELLLRLADRSQSMERELRQLRQFAPAVVRVGHQLGRTRVESRLRALDYGLSRAGAEQNNVALKRAYWNERVRLLDSMLEMERAELIRQDLAGYRVVPVSQKY